MEINITLFFRNATPMDYSASRAEIGDNAAADTWNAALDDSDDYLMIATEDQREEFRRYIKGFGAWDTEEIANMSDKDLNALFIQMVAGDIREADLNTTNPDWNAYEKLSERGQISSRIYASGDEVFYYVGE
jgi:hypothetical protein